MKTDTKLPVVKDSLTPNSDTPTQIIYRRVEKDIDSNKWWWATCYSVKEAENLVNLLNGYEKKLAASKSDATMLRSQLKRAVEIAEKIWADCSNGSEHTELAALKEEIK
jgi:hypothetical protein